MSSLYERLKSAGQGGKRPPPRPAGRECRVIQALEKSLLPPDGEIGTEVLRLMTGREWVAPIRYCDILFLDTETTGLSGGAGTLAFLAGTGRQQGEGFCLSQYLMRDYDEEGDLLKRLSRDIAESRLVVSFNGAAFDLPLLESRRVLHRCPSALQDVEHIDLLHVARRVYARRLKSCTLAALEREVLGLAREGDLPGREVPGRFFAYLRSREEALLFDVLRHNARDVLSLADLMQVLLRLHGQPLTARHEEELYSLGRVFEKRGDAGRAGVCYRALKKPLLREEAGLRLAELYRRQRRDGQAEAEYRRLLKPGRTGVRACIALSKLFEHRRRDPRRALALARKGMLYCLAQPEAAESLSAEYEDLKRRVARLVKKTGGGVVEDTFRDTGAPGAVPAPERPDPGSA